MEKKKQKTVIQKTNSLIDANRLMDLIKWQHEFFFVKEKLSIGETFLVLEAFTRHVESLDQKIAEDTEQKSYLEKLKQDKVSGVQTSKWIT